MDAHRSSSTAGERPGTRGGRRARRPPLDEGALAREASRYLARWEATRQGVRDVLLRRIERDEALATEERDRLRAAVPEIIDSLGERGYVDDRRFARQAIDRMRRQGRSRLQIRERLRSKGVPDALVDETIRAWESEAAADRVVDPDVCEGSGAGESEPWDTELAAAWATARRRRLGPYRRDPVERGARRERDLAVLARSGFSREIAYRIVDAEAPPAADPTP